METGRECVGCVIGPFPHARECSALDSCIPVLVHLSESVARSELHTAQCRPSSHCQEFTAPQQGTVSNFNSKFKIMYLYYTVCYTSSMNLSLKVMRKLKEDC